MSTDLFEAPRAPRLTVLDDADAPVGAFPVGRVFCVGRNYADHAREMGSDPDREPPFFFLKPASAVTGGPEVPWPSCTEDLHHEVELVLAVGAALRDAEPSASLAAIVGCGVGLDLTRRDLQALAKAAGQPWEAGKVFDGAAVIGPLRAGTAVLDDPAAGLALDVDGELRQRGGLDRMIWSPAEILARLSVLFGLRPGDVVFTGTPAGVGPLSPGSVLEASVDGLPPLCVRMGRPSGGAGL